MIFIASFMKIRLLDQVSPLREDRHAQIRHHLFSLDNKSKKIG